MEIVKSFVVILYSVNAINHNRNQQECLLHVEKDHHVPNHFINDGCQLFINGILVGVQ